MLFTVYYKNMPVQISIVPIIPPKNFAGAKFDAMQTAVNKVLAGKVADLLESDLETRASGWSSPPKWNAKVANFTLVLSTRSKKWLWVSGGTRARAIYPRRAKYLAIRGYKAKTHVSGVAGRSGAGRDGSYVYAKSAPNYPGIAARAFEDKIVKHRGGQVIALIQAAVDTA